MGTLPDKCQGWFKQPIQPLNLCFRGSGDALSLSKGGEVYPTSPTNNVSHKRFFVFIVDGKCRRLYLAPKNKIIQSNLIFFIHTQNWLPDRNNQTTPPSKRAVVCIAPSRVGKGFGVRSVDSLPINGIDYAT